MTCDATILIAARNASETIRRAAASALAQGDYSIILIDDHSEDDTVARAKEIAGHRLEVIQPSEHRTLGLTRQTGLMAVETPFAVWLDADDELLPGRIDRMVSELRARNADLASDCIQLCEGISGIDRGVLYIPSFLKGMNPLARLFERNYLPGIGVVGFRTEFARRIGYDPVLHGAEDVDFVLRAIVEGARFCLLDSVGYRQYSYPNSLSRQIENQRSMYKAALLKHDYEAVRRLYRLASLDARITAWGLLSMAVFREDYSKALEFLIEAEALAPDPDEVLEPAGDRKSVV
jgi:glycosyltransferase involved in cell wall biosynthesis